MDQEKMRPMIDERSAGGERAVSAAGKGMDDRGAPLTIDSPWACPNVSQANPVGPSRESVH